MLHHHHQGSVQLLLYVSGFYECLPMFAQGPLQLLRRRQHLLLLLPPSQQVPLSKYCMTKLCAISQRVMRA